MVKNREIKSDNIKYAFFSVYSEINRSRAFFSIFAKAIAEHCHFSLTEVTVIRKNPQFFFIVNKRATVACEVSFWYKANY